MNIFKDWLDRLITISLCVLIVTLPFSKSMVEASIITAFILWLSKKTLSYKKDGILPNLYRPLRKEIGLPLLIFVCANILSTLISSSVPLSIKGFFFKLLGGVFLALIITDNINDRKRLNYILYAICLSVSLICIDGIFQAFTGRDFLRHYPSFGRISASFINPNGFSGWIIVMLPIIICAACVRKENMPKKIARLALWVLSIMLMVCLILTRSRGASIGIIFSIAFFIMIKRTRIFLVAASILIIVVLIASPYFIRTHQDSNILMSEFAEIRSWDDAVSWVKDSVLFLKKQLAPIMGISDFARVNLWREAIFIIKDYPIFGCGLNTYSFIAPRYKSGLSESGIYCHNSYLQMAAETGIIGLTAFLWLVLALLETSLKNLKIIKDGFYSNVLIGLLVGMLAFLVHSFFDVNLYALQLVNLMWFVMGLIIAVQNTALKEQNA